MSLEVSDGVVMSDSDLVFHKRQQRLWRLHCEDAIRAVDKLVSFTDPLDNKGDSLLHLAKTHKQLHQVGADPFIRSTFLLTL